MLLLIFTSAAIKNSCKLVDYLASGVFKLFRYFVCYNDILTNFSKEFNHSVYLFFLVELFYRVGTSVCLILRKVLWLSPLQCPFRSFLC